MAVDSVAMDEPFGPPRELLQKSFEPAIGTSGNLTSNYDVTADGEFLMVLRDERAASGENEVVVILDWFSELERLVPEE